MSAGGWGAACFGGWVVVVAALLAALARAESGSHREMGQGAANLANLAAGWQVQHWLPSEHGLTPVLARLLIDRGPRPGVNEKIHLDVRGDALKAKLARAGWSVVMEAPEFNAPLEPQLRVIAPTKARVWSGGYRAEELRSEGAVLLDDLVLLQLVRGQAGPAQVPVGCASPAAERTVKFPKLFPWL